MKNIDFFELFDESGEMSERKKKSNEILDKNDLDWDYDFELKCWSFFAREKVHLPILLIDWEN